LGFVSWLCTDWFRKWFVTEVIRGDVLECWSLTPLRYCQLEALFIPDCRIGRCDDLVHPSDGSWRKIAAKATTVRAFHAHLATFRIAARTGNLHAL
jgi:hypothetical protein